MRARLSERCDASCCPLQSIVPSSQLQLGGENRMTAIKILSNSPIGCRMCPGGPVVSSMSKAPTGDRLHVKARVNRREGRLRLRLDPNPFHRWLWRRQAARIGQLLARVLAATEKLKIITAIPPAHGTQGGRTHSDAVQCGATLRSKEERVLRTTMTILPAGYLSIFFGDYFSCHRHENVITSPMV